MENAQNNILILGLGNEILCDDAIGIKLIDDLKNRIDTTGIDFNKMCVGGLEIVELIKDYDLIIVIDSMRSTFGVPGELYCFEPESFKETLHLTSLHDISFLSALKLVNKIYSHTPHKLAILAIEIIEDQYFSEQFTPEIENKYPGILIQVEKQVKKLLQEYKNSINTTGKITSKNKNPHLTK